MESKKNYTNEIIQNRNRHTDIENKLMVTKGERAEGKIRSMRLIETHYYT